MKRIISLFLVFVLLFSLCSLAACGGDEGAKGATSSKSQSKTSSFVSSKNASVEIGSSDVGNQGGSNVNSDASSKNSSDSSLKELALKNSGEITIYAGLPGKFANTSSWWEDFYQYYKENYNGTVNLISEATFNDWCEYFIKAFASNTAPDLIQLYYKNWPSFANRGMVFSIEEMKEIGIAGLDSSYLTDGLELVEDEFAYGDKHYAFAMESVEPVMIFVNEDLFKKYGVKSPSTYYKEGKWNWQTLELCAAEISKDTNFDGKNDVYGYTGWDASWIVTAAGGQIITLNKDKSLSVTMEKESTWQGLVNCNKIYKSKSALYETVSTTSFASGKAGMNAGMPKGMYSYLFGKGSIKKVNFEWSMVPYPLDERTNKSGVRPGEAFAWGVCSQSNNPQGCINFMIAVREYSKSNPQPDSIKYEEKFTKSQMKMIESCKSKIDNATYQGVNNLWNGQWEFWYRLRGTTVEGAVNYYKPLFEQVVEEEKKLAK
ncbi:MAG: extracellular solute-binding protein [Clostridia bacterium]|nr:extracellular solute-binding protein [Clostridia bacterium]